MRLRSVCAALAALLITACATPPRQLPAPPAAESSAALAESIAAAARRSDDEPDAHIRSELADTALQDAAACVQRDPGSAACLYRRGIALGLQAKSHPARAVTFLGDMLDSLARAEAVDANYDEAGPARVQALVLIRAPGWPLGPGDPERGLAAALRAVNLRPAYPPNLLALAEAQAKMGAADDARASYARARDAAGSFPDSGSKTEWQQEAERGLTHPP